MSAWYITPYLTDINYLDFLLRIFLAAICGALIGAEREKRLKNAGLRTHIIVAITAALMMIVSKYAYFDVTAIDGVRLQADVSRTAHGVISAIGFLGAGVIFVRKESIVGLTTAAGLWATVGIGLTIGAGMYGVGIITTIFVLLIQAVLHKYHLKTRNQMCGKVTSNITKHKMTMKQFEEYLSKMNVTIRDVSYAVADDESIVVSASVVFPANKTTSMLLEELSAEKILDSVDLSHAM